MKKLTATAVAFTVALTSSAAFANKHEGDYAKKMEEKFNMADTNKDGAISKDEWNAKSMEMFTKIDENGDGNVTMEEKKAFMKTKHDKYHKDDRDQEAKDKDRM